MRCVNQKYFHVIFKHKHSYYIFQVVKLFNISRVNQHRLLCCVSDLIKHNQMEGRIPKVQEQCPFSFITKKTVCIVCRLRLNNSVFDSKQRPYIHSLPKHRIGPGTQPTSHSVSSRDSFLSANAAGREVTRLLVQ